MNNIQVPNKIHVTLCGEKGNKILYMFVQQKADWNENIVNLYRKIF